MDILRIITILTIIFISLILLIFIFSKKGFKMLFFNIILGLIMLFIINLTAKLTNVYIPINQFTVGGSVAFGIPGIILFLIMQLIFI